MSAFVNWQGISQFIGARFKGVPVVIDPNVPLIRINEDGTETPLLAVRVGDRVLVHPERYDEFVRSFSSRLPAAPRESLFAEGPYR